MSWREWRSFWKEDCDMLKYGFLDDDAYFQCDKCNRSSGVDCEYSLVDGIAYCRTCLAAQNEGTVDICSKNQREIDIDDDDSECGNRAKKFKKIRQDIEAVFSLALE